MRLFFYCFLRKVCFERSQGYRWGTLFAFGPVWNADSPAFLPSVVPRIRDHSIGDPTGPIQTVPHPRRAISDEGIVV